MKLTSLFCAAILFVSGAVSASPDSRQAAVAMPEPLSAEAAARVLREGGNAVDAAVAAAFVLAVTFPGAGNIGGGGFMVLVMDGEPAFLDFRERAPAAASRDMYLDEQGEVNSDLPYTGALSVGTPGTVRGLQAAHGRYGSLSWARVVQPAIALARDGFVMSPKLAAEIEEEMKRFDQQTNFADYFSRARAGQVFKQAELAQTLTRIAADPDDFYSGTTAALLVAQMQRDKGLITVKDLQEYTAIWRTPIQFSWRDYQVISAAPPSSGGIALAQLLGMHQFAGEHFADVDHNSAQYLHLLAEIEKRVFADRGKYLGDPAFHDNPVEQLIGHEYLKQRATEISPQRISAAATVLPGLDSVDTTHLSVVDAAGNAVSLTYTLNWDFGSGVVVAGAGFLLNDEMDDFSAKPGVPNKFGVVGDVINAIEPGKRMLSSMSPTILLQGDEVAFVLGTHGGSTIFTSIFQVLLNLVEFGMTAQEAVDADRFHHQLPQHELIRYDRSRSIPAVFAERMAEYGYRMEPNSWGDLGDIMLIVRDEDGLEAAVDVRGRGQAQVLSLP